MKILVFLKLVDKFSCVKRVLQQKVVSFSFPLLYNIFKSSFLMVLEKKLTTFAKV